MTIGMWCAHDKIRFFHLQGTDQDAMISTHVADTRCASLAAEEAHIQIRPLRPATAEQYWPLPSIKGVCAVRKHECARGKG